MRLTFELALKLTLTVDIRTRNNKHYSQRGNIVSTTREVDPMLLINKSFNKFIFFPKQPRLDEKKLIDTSSYLFIFANLTMTFNGNLWSPLNVV